MLKYINKVAAEEQIDPDLLQDAFKDCLLQIKHTLEMPEMPKVVIHGFGTFTVTIPRLELFIKSILETYKKGKITKEQTKKQLDKLFRVRRRLKNEEKARKEKRKDKREESEN